MLQNGLRSKRVPPVVSTLGPLVLTSDLASAALIREYARRLLRHAIPLFLSLLRQPPRPESGLLTSTF